MKKLFEDFGILIQIPFLLFVLIYFPLGGQTIADDSPVVVNASFYIFQTLICLLPISQHIIGKKLLADTISGPAFKIICFGMSFILTVINCYRFQ